MNESGGGEILKACVWNSTVEPGITVSMAMVLRKLKGSGAAEHDCPSCDSPYEGVERKELERAQWYISSAPGFICRNFRPLTVIDMKQEMCNVVPDIPKITNRGTLRQAEQLRSQATRATRNRRAAM